MLKLVDNKKIVPASLAVDGFALANPIRQTKTLHFV
jgi:hypothetical protein